jgi:hypothetical protein
MNVKGKIIEVSEITQVKETFKKRDFVLEFAENAMYPEYIKFELIQDKVSIVDNMPVGTMVDVSFNLRGRAWTNAQGVKSYFNSLQAWRVVVENGAIAQAPQAQGYSQQGGSAPIQDTFSQTMQNSTATVDDDMPF